MSKPVTMRISLRRSFNFAIARADRKKYQHKVTNKTALNVGNERAADISLLA